MSRFRALLMKELLDLGRNRSALVPVFIVTATSFILPFLVVVVVPAFTGEPLSADRDLWRLSAVVGSADGLSPAGRVQLFLFQQFLLLFLLTPVTGAMSLAAHAVVGEKQSRTLEPLLATPIGTAELLVAKVLGAFIPTAAISTAGLLCYFGLIAATGEPGVFVAMFGARTLLLVCLVGPMVALVSLQLALIVSSRVNDTRTAQQFSVLIILPLTGILVAQFLGAFWLSTAAIASLGVGLFCVWVLLTLVSVALFEREAILTRWR